MHELRVAVICPMAIEREAVETELLRAGFARDAAGPTRRADGPPMSVFGGSGVRVRVIQCGIGKAAVVAAVEGVAAAGSGTGDDEGGVALVVLAGAAGGLAQTVDVPRIARVVREEAGAGAQAGWTPSDAPAAGDDAAVTLVGVDRVVATPRQKRELARATGAAVVDMESHAFAAACERLGVMWTVVRGVSDTPDETLPGIVVNWLDPAGNTRAWRAARDLAVRPWLVPHMLKVMKRTNTVLPKVGKRVVELTRGVAAIHAGTGTRGDGPNAPQRGVAAAERGAPVTPMPLTAGERFDTVVLVGGTFDPPHRAHVEMAAAARDALMQREGGRGAGVLVFVPAARSPHKEHGPIASDADRLAMLHAAVDGVAGAGVWTDELDRAAWEREHGVTAGPSYFIDTLRRARHELDERAEGIGQEKPRLMFVIGADQAERFHLWHDARGILDLAEPVVLPRGKVRTAVELRDLMASVSGPGGKPFWSDEECRWWGQKLIEMPVRDVCATSLRAALAAGTDPAMLADALSETVARVIGERGVYSRSG